MNKVEAIIRPEKFEQVKNALAAAGFASLNAVQVTGRGAQRGVTYTGRTGEKHVVDMLPKTKVELVVKDDDTQRAIDIILSNARTGDIGDGKIFVLPVGEVIRVRTGERGDAVI